MSLHPTIFIFFFFNDTATTEIYTLSLHDALPISTRPALTRKQIDENAETYKQQIFKLLDPESTEIRFNNEWFSKLDRKSTRLNSSHLVISYAVFCLKKKKMNIDRLHYVCNNYHVI